MKAILLLVGKIDDDYVRKVIKLFEVRLKHYLPFEIA